ncbi:MAG: SDR family NAD(P)-dependent oxidoreductase [Alphaproteobacteria bacterium]|nr:SDR family NAD(P)-dependent oxidoreductase [Alphaproteobacteria bacterium]
MRDSRHILITGASSGIGAALATDYAAPGVRLALHGRNEERLSHVAEQARQRGADVLTHIGDVTDAKDMAAWVVGQDAEAPIDLLIASAGISGGTALFCESADQVKAIFAVNVTGVFNTVQPALSLMMQRKRGQIALLSSLAGFRGFPGAPAYCASKAAVRVYGEGLRGEMARHNVQINVVCPGFVKTPMTDVNPFPMPFLISAERAASLIRKGLAANCARIAFPLPMYIGVRFLTALPQPLIDAITSRMPKK